MMPKKPTLFAKVRAWHRMSWAQSRYMKALERMYSSKATEEEKQKAVMTAVAAQSALAKAAKVLDEDL